MVDVRPDPKPVTEGGIGRKKPPRHARKRGRLMATEAEWAAIRATKVDGRPCRICTVLRPDHQAHHLVLRSRGGDDVADNIVPLCVDPDSNCHKMVTEAEPHFLRLLAAKLSDAEYAYVIGKLGEGAMQRLFGVDRV